MSRRVVVTGLGMISPIGNDVDSSWSAALEGKSGVGLNEYFDTEDYSVKICAAVKNLCTVHYSFRARLGISSTCTIIAIKSVC